MRRPLIGARIRERRRRLGLTHAALAGRVGVSASYLNLIEANKRPIGGALLRRLAVELELAIDELDGAAERGLLADLAELAADPILASLRLDAAAPEELVGRHGAWARALVRLHREYRARGKVIAALSDRLTQDPFLGESVHGLLTHLAAVRSAAEILESVRDLDEAQRSRFVSIIGAESRGLSALAQALAAYFERTLAGTPPTPAEEVDDFLLERNNHFPALERAADALRAAIGGAAPPSTEALSRHLESAFGVRVELRAVGTLPPAAQRRGHWLDEGTGVLTLAYMLPEASRRFVMARLLAERFERGEPIRATLEGSAVLTSDAGRARASAVLAAYLACALLLPYEPFLEAAVHARYDIDFLGVRFGASYEQVCHRLATLRRPGAEGIPWALLRVDPAGFVTKRLPLPHLLLPRYGVACPLWAAYAAFQTPGTTVRQLAAFPTEDRFLFVARAIEKPRPGHGLPRRLLSIMLACDALYADRTIYGEGLDISSAAPAVPVGPSCRLCPRAGCAFRQEEAIAAA